MITLLKKDDYWTQRNNKWDDPATANHERWVACFPTGAVMFYIAGGYGAELDKANNTEWAHDDWFMALLRSDEAWSVAREKYSELIALGFTPNEIHGMYHTYLEPKVFGRRLSDFRTPMSFEEFVREIQERKLPILTSGAYDSKMFGRIVGHVSVAHGLADNGALIFSDPLGDPWTLYESDQGYGVEFTKEQFETHNKHWGHVFIE